MSEPKEPKREKILEFLDSKISHLEKRLDSSERMGWFDKVAVIKPDLLMFQAIRRLIEAVEDRRTK